MLTSRVLEMAKVGLYLWKTRHNHKRVTSPTTEDAAAKKFGGMSKVTENFS